MRIILYLAVFQNLFLNPVYSQPKVIHVFVALCDNKYQGIVPVPSAIGNGQDPKNNLYWGCQFGVKTFFKASKEWTFIKSILNPDEIILERIVFKHKTQNVYLVADAYNGKEIKTCITNFFKSCAGDFKSEIIIDNKKILCGSNSNLICYVGHDGLMDFDLDNYPVSENEYKREAMILACYSKSYFKEGIKKSGANALLWTTGLCSPEAYTLHDAINGWIKNESAELIRARAAKAYSKYQKCSVGAASKLWVSE